MPLDDIVDMRNSAGDEESEDEGNDVVLADPEGDVDGVENDEDSEAPVDAVDDDALASREELVDKGPNEDEMDDCPNPECPRSRSQVGLLATKVDIVRTSNAVDVGTEEEEVDKDVDDLEEDTVTPRVSFSHVLSLCES